MSLRSRRAPCSGLVAVALSSLALGASPVSPARADIPPIPQPDEETDPAMGRHLQSTLRAHGAEIHGCYGAALSDKPGLSGEVLMRLVVAPGGGVERAEVLKDQTGSPRLTACLMEAMRKWRVPDLAGSAPQHVVFPLAFQPDPADAAKDAAKQQNAQKPPQPPTANVPHARFVVARRDGKPGPIGKGNKVEARVLIAEGTVGPTKASLTELKLHPTARLSLHQHPASSEIVYVVAGLARVRNGTGVVTNLNAGDAAVFPAGDPHSLESAPLAPLTLLQLFVPAGPEHAYLDPTDRAGTVSAHKDLARAPAPNGIALAANARSYPIAGGKGEATLYLDGGLDKQAGASLQRFEAQAGTVIPVHAHDASDEILFVISGRGEMSVNGSTISVGAGDAIHIPTGAPHGLSVSEKLVAVQCYAPGGPEQRFKSKAENKTELARPTH